MHTKNNSKCSACGTSPVNHHLLLTSSILEETLGRFLDKIFNLSLDGDNKISMRIEKMLFNFFYFIQIVKFSKDIEKAVTGRSKLIWQEAKDRNIEMEQVLMFGKPIEYYRAKINKKWFYFASLPIPPTLKQTGYRWLDDKLILSKILNKNNIASPKSIEILTLKDTEKAFHKLSKPVIIKPKNGSRSRHTTTGIKTLEDAKKAFKLGREITLAMVMQEHIYGSVYRATVINNKLVGFFKANPAQITGDGNKTIQELILEKNKNKKERLSDILINQELLNFIDRQGYKLNSILEKDKTIDLTGKTGRNYGGYTKEMLPLVHPKLHEIFRKAGEIVQAPVVGFDLIMEDPTIDPDTQKWGIIECNSLPFIDLHYFPLEGTPINLAKNVWDLWN
jgi:cyanophycin synthetase